MTYTVILSPDAETSVVVAICPAMPGAVAEGVNRERSLEALAEVMAAWLEMAASDGYEPLAETPGLIAAKVASVIEDRDASGWDRAIETTALEPRSRALA